MLRRVCDTIWHEWQKLPTHQAKQGAGVPEFLCFGTATQAEISVTQFNQVILDITKGGLDEGDRRVAPGLLHMRRAELEARLALAGWKSGKMKA